MTNLWTLTLPADGNGSLPILTRGNTAPSTSTTVNGATVSQLRFKNYNGTSDSKDYINVVGDFQWTKSPVISRGDVPEIFLYERRILVNNTISNAAYSVFATLDGGATIAKTLKEAGDVATGGAIGTAIANFQNSVIGKQITDKLTKWKQDINNLSTQFNSPALAPYSGLYITENTGFNYIFPYMDNNYFNATATYGEGSGSGILTTALDMVKDLGEIVTNLAGAIKPGVYIERAKQFTFGDQGRSITVKFPLLNTGSFDDISQNWQLLFALIYQNRPGRVDKNIIDLPEIYSVEIPGVVSLPYAYISGLTIDFLGNRRQMQIPIPNVIAPGSPTLTNIRTIIPDAYQVTITISGLNEETRNFLFAGLQPNQVTVTVPKSTP